MTIIIIINFHVRHINHLYQLLIIILIIIVMDNFYNALLIINTIEREREEEREGSLSIYYNIYIVINNGRQAHFLRHNCQKKNKFL